MQIIEQSISFPKKLAFTFSNNKQIVQIFGLLILLTWIIIFLLGIDLESIWASRKRISWSVGLVFIILFSLTNYVVWLFIKKFWRNEKQIFRGLQKGMILTNSVNVYTIEPDFKVSEWNFQLSFNDYDLEFEAKWIFKIGEFAYITQPARLIKRVGREEQKVHFIQKGIGEIATSLYKIDDDTLYDSFGVDSFTQADKKNIKPMANEEIIIAKSAQQYLRTIAKKPVQILYNPQNPQINYVLIDTNGEAIPTEILSEKTNNIFIWLVFIFAIAACLSPYYIIFAPFIF